MGEPGTVLLVEALRLAVVLSVPVAVAALVSGLLSGLLQNLTAWNDTTLTHTPRLAAVVVAWVLTGPWVARELGAFAARAWGAGV